MDERTLVNILSEIAELEELREKAREILQRNAKRDRELHELQDEYRSDAEAADAEAGSRGRTFRAIEGEMRQVEARLEDRRQHQALLADPRQHQALGEEIAALESRLARLEDEALGCLDEEESLAGAADEARRESREHGLKTEQDLHDLQDQSRAMAKRVANIDLDLHRLVGMLPPAEKRHVERLRGKLDRSVVYQHSGACCGCFNQLPVQEALNVDRGRTVIRCPSCLRYIVHRPWK